MHRAYRTITEGLRGVDFIPVPYQTHFIDGAISPDSTDGFFRLYPNGFNKHRYSARSPSKRHRLRQTAGPSFATIASQFVMTQSGDHHVG